MCYVSQNVTCLWKFRMQFKFCLPGDTHQIRFHWHGSISLPFLCRMPAFGALRVADQNSFKVRARKQFEVVLEMTSVLWLISVVSGSSYSFQIATEGEASSQWKTAARGQRQSVQLTQAWVRWVLTFPTRCPAAFHHFLQSPANLFKRPLSYFVLCFLGSHFRPCVNFTDQFLLPSMLQRGPIATRDESLTLIMPPPNILQKAPLWTHVYIYLIIGTRLCKISGSYLASYLHSRVLLKKNIKLEVKYAIVTTVSSTLQFA